MDANPLLFHAGDLVRCRGHVVRTDAALWLDLARIVDTVADRPADWHSEFSVLLTGQQAEQLKRRQGEPTYNTEVVGRWSADGNSIEVKSWSSSETLEENESALWTDPPCPPPSDGWPSGKPLNFDISELECSEAVVSYVIFRPAARRQVLVVAATDIAAATALLRPQVQGRLCVVQSRFTKEQLAQAVNDLEAHAHDWRLESWTGGQVDSFGQPFVEAFALFVTSEMATWIESVPDGLLSLEVAILPA